MAHVLAWGDANITMRLSNSFVKRWLVLKRTVGVMSCIRRLAGAGVLGDGFGPFADGVLSELAGQQQTNGGLDLAAGDGRALVVVSESGTLGGDPLEYIIHERIHDAHCLARDAGVGMHLLKHFININTITLPPSSLVLLITSTRRFSFRNSFLGTLRRCFWRHDCK